MRLCGVKFECNFPACYARVVCNFLERASGGWGICIRPDCESLFAPQRVNGRRRVEKFVRRALIIDAPTKVEFKACVPQLLLLVVVDGDEFPAGCFSFCERERKIHSIASRAFECCFFRSWSFCWCNTQSVSLIHLPAETLLRWIPEHAPGA